MAHGQTGRPSAATAAARRAPHADSRAAARRATITGLVGSNLGKSFRRRPVLRAVNISVQRGEAVGLLGPNGAGKTTCFYIITGLIRPDSAPSSSTARTSPSCRCTAAPGLASAICRRRRRSSAASRSSRICAPCSRWRSRSPRRARRRSTRCSPSSRSAICAARRRWRFRAASGGASRSPARSPRKPHFILLDEPLAGIDPIAVGDIRDLVAHLKDRGIGVLITDHNVREALEIVDRAYILHEGQVLMEGEPERDRQRRRRAPRLSGRAVQPLDPAH